MASFEVFLANCGNIDRGQDPDRPLYATKSGYWKPVDSLENASRACRDYIESYDLGGGNWIGGAVRDAGTKEEVAKISYNGRIWPVEDESSAPKP